MSTADSKLPRVLTGITTTGTPHLGNYAGAIRQAVAASRDAGVRSFYFLADLHGLIKCPEPERIQRSTLEIAACWLAAGLDPDKVLFYRQSDLPEIPELCWYLSCVTGKGLLNRAHAYKAVNDRNREAGVDLDTDVTAGLFMYPVLMAADILIFGANRVPVGRDQVQHLEIARDIAQRFNHLYGEVLTLPEVQVDENVGTLPGLDGRKMSKSYDNTIPLFSDRRQLERLIAGIITDSRGPGEPKDADGSVLYQLYQAFATSEQSSAFRRALQNGLAWGEAKRQLLEQLDQTLAPMRERYQALIAKPEAIEEILQAGARKARAEVAPLMRTVRSAVGIRSLRQAGAGQAADARPSGEMVGAAAGAAAVTAGRAGSPGSSRARPLFKQYREADGRFYFKFIDGAGAVLLQSLGFDRPKACGECIAFLKQNPGQWQSRGDMLEPVAEDRRAAVEAALRALSED
ncbi:MAG: tryptophan--tRNA ligase [Lautropia sp.]|nr:tryptophan--tRNA ligase [Lautropia sp.]